MSRVQSTTMSNHLVEQVVSSLVFSGLGLVMFGISFMSIKAVLPFSLRKEI